MYKIKQYSLKEYGIVNNGNEPIYLKLSEYVNDRYVDVEEYVIDATSDYRLFLPNDGLFLLVVYSDSENTTILDRYIIHNIQNILEKRQLFLTNVLTGIDPDKCNHNQYYDVTSFNIIFETYKKVVRDTFMTDIIPHNLYLMGYLMDQLKKYING